MSQSAASNPAEICPACRGLVRHGEHAAGCERCDRAFPWVAGMIDWRLRPDRYLSLDAERAKAERLGDARWECDFHGLAELYYDRTDDVDAQRRKRFLQHIRHAEARGAVLARLLPKRGKILEIGCGTGGLLVAARRNGQEIEGVDIAARWLVLARSRLDQASLEAALGVANAEALPYPDNLFEVVVADSVLEHLDDPIAALREWLRVVRPGGQLLLWSPNRWTLFPDPHVGLWGLGFLPRRAQVRRVQRLRGCDWPIRLTSAQQSEKMAEQAGWRSLRVAAAPEPARLSPILAGLYESARMLPVLSRLLRTLGPLWQLRGVKPAGTAR